jgi:hypothetical protein
MNAEGLNSRKMLPNAVPIKNLEGDPPGFRRVLISASEKEISPETCSRA